MTTWILSWKLWTSQKYMHHEHLVFWENIFHIWTLFFLNVLHIHLAWTKMDFILITYELHIIQRNQSSHQYKYTNCLWTWNQADKQGCHWYGNSFIHCKSIYYNVKSILPYTQLMSEEQSNLHIKFLNISTKCLNTVFIPENVSQQANRHPPSWISMRSWYNLSWELQRQDSGKLVAQVGGMFFHHKSSRCMHILWFSNRTYMETGHL